MKKGATAVTTTWQPITPDDVRHEVGTVVGGVVKYGCGPLNIAVGMSKREWREYEKRN